MPPDSPNPTNRHGRTAIIVLLMMLATAGGFAAISLIVDSDTQGVLQMLAIIIGSVGTGWAILLAVRAAVKGESLFFPFLVLLPIFWALCYPLLATWPTNNRGVDDKWYFLHFFLFPLTIPLGMLALTVATPALIWFRRRTARAEEVDRPRLRKRARLIFLATVSAVFVLLAPFGFYLYGGTMRKESHFWTEDAVAAMPFWIGDVEYRLLRRIPNAHCEMLADEMLGRGILSSEVLVAEIGQNPNQLKLFFEILSERSPTMALDVSRKQMTASQPVISMVYFFACNAPQDEIKSYLNPDAFVAMDPKASDYFVYGLGKRRDTEIFAKDIAALIDEKKVGLPASHAATNYFAESATDVESRSIYLKLLEMESVNIENITVILVNSRKFTVVDEGVQFPDPVSREAVLRGIFSIANRSVDNRTMLEEIKELVPQLTRLLDSSHEPDRIYSALSLLTAVKELTPMTLDLYSTKVGDRLKLSLDRATDTQKRALVEHAREVVKSL